MEEGADVSLREAPGGDAAQRSTGADEPGAYFVRTSERTYRATEHTGGGWDPNEQHISPLNGLAVHAIERARAEPDQPGQRRVISRITFDILGTVPIDVVAVDVAVTRPGRTVELVEAVIRHGERDVLHARAWRLASFDTAAVAGGAAPPMPSYAETPRWPMAQVWPGGFVASLDIRREALAEGRSRAWLSSPLQLVEGEECSPTASFVSLIDIANGIAARQPPERWLYPNVDLTIHFVREPARGPVGLDTTVTFGPTGQGLTSTVLHDARGHVGQAAQSLTVRPRPRS
jgi:hypothetical protein